MSSQAGKRQTRFVPVVCCNVLQRVLQSVAVCCSVLQRVLQCAAVCCSVLQCVLHCVTVCSSVLQRVLQCVTVCCNVLQRVLQCVTVCRSVLQRVLQCCSVTVFARILRSTDAYAKSRQASVRYDSCVVGLFCRILSLLLGSFAKETHNFIDPTAKSYTLQQAREWVHRTLLSRAGNVVKLCVKSKQGTYGVASVSRIDYIMSLFCKRAL